MSWAWQDVIADIKWAQKLARKLEAATVVTDAGHLITRESLEEVIAPLPQSTLAHYCCHWPVSCLSSQINCRQILGQVLDGGSLLVLLFPSYQRKAIIAGGMGWETRWGDTRAWALDSANWPRPTPWKRR